VKKNWAAILYVAFIFAGLLFTAYTTYQDYFIRWGSISELYIIYDAGVTEIGQYIRKLPAEETVYLSPTWREDASLLLHSNQRADIRAYNGRHCFVFPQQTETPTTYVIVPHDDKNSLPLLSRYFPQGQAAYEGVLGNGEHYFTAYQISGGSSAQFSPQVPLEANWDNKIKLLGYDLEKRVYASGENISLTLYYQPLTDMKNNFTTFIHLWGEADPASGNIIYGQQDREPCFQSYPTSFWQAGEVIRDTFTIPITPAAKPGAYQLVTGFYQWPELTRLPLLETTAAASSDAVILSELELAG
jgi:hypothetical protein